MKTPTANFTTEKNKVTGAAPRTLLEIDADSGTLYYSDQYLNVQSDWTLRTSAADNFWRSVCYGNGLYVAVASSGTGNRVMTSPDGATWTIRTSAADSNWTSVCYGNGLFVAVADSGSLGNRVMTSPDGVTWTARTAASLNWWQSVCYGNGKFVAVAYAALSNDGIMTSPDGIAWTLQSNGRGGNWRSVCYGNGLFVAVENITSGNKVMTSPDGATWTIRTSAADNYWTSVCYGNGLFVAVADSGTGNRVMASTNGATWTLYTSAADNFWQSICYGNGLYVAVASSGTGNRVMTNEAIVYNAKVMNWNEIVSQVVPGEEVVRTGGMSLELTNNPRIDESIRAGLEVRLYIWFAGLVAADKLLYFRGIINNDISGDIYKISFTCTDIGDYWDKKLGTTLSLDDYPGTDPDDVGKIIPWGYGAFSNQPCLAIDAGAVSTLAVAYTGGDGSVTLTDAAAPIAFPSSGTFIIGDETGTYTGKSGNVLSGVTGVSEDYVVGTKVLQNKASVKFIVRDHITKSLSNARILPIGKRVEEAVSIPAASVTYNTNDSGVSTITLTDLLAIKKKTSTTGESPLHGHSGGVPSNTERHSTYVWTNQSYNNPDYARDGNDSTYADTTTSGPPDTHGLVLAYDTTDLGSITKVEVIIRSQTISGSARVYWGWNGSDWDGYQDLPASLATRTYQVAITSWSRIERMNFLTMSSSEARCHEMYYKVYYDTAVGQTAVTVDIGGNSVADTLGGILICDGEGYADSEDIVVGTDTNDYKCILQHIASAATKPITGGSYTTYWSATGGSGSGNTWVSGKNYAEDGHYTGVADTLITKPWEVIHHLLENRSNGITHSDIDLSGSFADVASSLSTYNWAVVCTEDGLYLNKLLALVAIQTWSRFVYEAGVAKLLRIKNSGGAGDKLININDGATSPLKDKRLQVSFKKPDLSQIYNNLEVKYDLDLTMGGWGTKEAYKGSTKDSDSTSIANYLTRDRTWLMFAVTDSTMADDLLAKLLDYWGNPKPPYRFPAILTQSELERGDLIELTCSQLGLSGNLCEILEADYSPPMPKNKQSPNFWFKVLYLLISNLRLTDAAQAGDALTKIDIDLSLTETIQAGDEGIIDITIPQLADTIQVGDETTVDITSPLSDGIQTGDTLTLLKSLWFFDSTRYYDSTKYFNSAP